MKVKNVAFALALAVTLSFDRTVDAQSSRNILMKFLIEPGNFRVKDNVIRYTLNQGSKLGIKAGKNGSLYRRYSSGIGKEELLVGKVEVADCWADSALLVLNFKEGFVLEGEAILLELPVAGEYAYSIPFILAREQISLLQVTGEGIFVPADYHSQKMTEDRLTDQLIADIHYTATEMRGEMDEPFIKRGRYASLGLFEAMEQSDETDIRLFFDYVATYPVKYAGKEWKIAEIYATWLDAGAPIVVTKMVERFMGADDAEWEALSAYAEPEILKSLVEAFCDKGDYLVEKGMGIEAVDQVFDRAVRLVAQFESAKQLGWLYFSWGDIAGSMEQAARAEQHYEKALVYYTVENFPVERALVLNNLGTVKRNTEGLKAASRAFEEAVSLLEAWDAKYHNNAVYSVLGLACANAADCYIEGKQYKKALGILEKGQKYLEAADPGEKRNKRLYNVYYAMEECLTQMRKEEEKTEIEAKRMALLQQMYVE